MEELVTLSPGARVSDRWTITKKLGAGAFGAVYMCQDNAGTTAALKAEPVVTPHPRLVMEAHVMVNVDKIRDGDGKHFCRCLDRGRDTQTDGKTGKPTNFNYIVMSLVGRGLDEVIKDAGGRLSPGCAISVMSQMLCALRGMHSIGYLHRDIKPRNSTIGRPENNELRLLYLIDFGRAGKFPREDGTHRRPRPSGVLRPEHPRYAGMSEHIGREYSRNDDIESWFYCLVEVFKGALPWASIGEMKGIGDMKYRRLSSSPQDVRRQAIAELLTGCPKEFGRILKHIDELRYTEQPDYAMIISTLRSCISANGFQEFPYDWETGKQNAATDGGGGGDGGEGDDYF